MEKSNILIVEDERIVAEDLRQLLEAAGYGVVGMVDTAEAAIVEAERTRPHLVLMDIMLDGDLDGISAARQISALFGMRVVFLTAYSDAEILARARSISPAGYVLKPFSENQLLAAVEIALHSRPRSDYTELAARAAAEQEGEKTRTLQALYIEDDPDDRFLMGEALADSEGTPVEMAYAEDLTTGLAYLEANQPQVILLDLNLPESRGLETLTRLRAQAPETPVVVLSGLGDEATATEALKLGAQDYLVKAEIAGASLRRVLKYALERHKLTGALQASERRSKEIVEHNVDGVLIIDQEGVICFLNPAAEHLFGQSAPDLIGQPFGFPVNLDESVEIEVRQNDGGIVDVEMGVAPIEWQGQLAYLASLRDITIRKQLEQAVIKERDFAESLIATAQAIVLVLDLEGRIVSFNPFMEGLSGYQLEEMVGCDWFETFLPERDRARHRQLFKQSVENTQSSGNINPIVCRDGREIPIEWSDKTLIDGNNKVIGLLAIGQDVTQRLESMRKVRKLNRLYETLSNCNQALVRAEDENALMETICRTIVEDGGYRMAWVGFAEQDEDKSVRPVAQHGFEPHYLETLKITWADKQGGRGPTGTAIRTGETVITADILNDAPNEKWRQTAIEQGYAASIAMPLFAKDNSVMGALNVFAVEPDAFDEAGTRLLTELAEDLAFGIRTVRARHALQSERQQLLSIFDNVPEIIYVADLQSYEILYVNQATQAAFSADLVGKKCYQALQGFESPCSFCTNEIIIEQKGTPYHWEYHNPTIDRWYDITDQIIQWPDGRQVRLELAIDITQRKLAEVEALENVARAQALVQAGGRLNAQLDLDTVLKVICEESALAVNIPVVCLSLFDEKRDEFYPVANYGLSPEVYKKFQPVPRQVYNDYLATEDPVFVISGRDDLSDLPNAAVYKALKTRTLLGVEVRHEEKIIGLLRFLVDSHYQLSEQEQALIRGLSDQATMAIVNAQLYATTQKRMQHLVALRNIDQAIAGSLDLHLVLDTLIDEVRTQLEVDAADVLIHNTDMNTLEYSAGKGFRTKALQHTNLPLGQGNAGKAAIERRVVHVKDIRAELNGLKDAPNLPFENFVSYYGVPLMAKSEVKGVLEIFHRSKLDPNEEWLDFLNALAGQAAIAVDSANLFDGMQRAHQELSLAYDDTIAGWSAAMDLRDEETEGHSQRVSRITLDIARELEISSAELVHVRRGALLHDMGKLGVPDSILLKPGKLTDDEWVIMRKHPVFAFNMLSPIKYLRPALDIPYCHHEKWDGSGYPRGLKGEQIPLAARIFAIVDVFDALSSDRPYRQAWPQEKVLAYIQELPGSHFDPQVVEVFMGMVKDL